MSAAFNADRSNIAPPQEVFNEVQDHLDNEYTQFFNARKAETQYMLAKGRPKVIQHPAVAPDAMIDYPPNQEAELVNMPENKGEDNLSVDNSPKLPMEMIMPVHGYTPNDSHLENFELLHDTHKDDMSELWIGVGVVCLAVVLIFFLSIQAHYKK
jgi:hypothetical protein